MRQNIWEPPERLLPYLIMFTKPYIGENNDLGVSSFESFLEALAENYNVPETVVFWNEAAEVCSEGHKLLPAVLELEKAGVRILVSEQAVTKFKIKNSLRAGRLANHFDLVVAINASPKPVIF
ncbi:MAG: hypothetical protein GX221_06785 [Candidatus Riflebacteria bacterium]|nr:hypothetical protein [Candidatus Riflebacteria bacterium]